MTTWQIEFQKLTVTEDQENGDQPYFVFFGFRSTPGVAGSSSAFWSHHLEDDWADGVTDSDGENVKYLPYEMGGMAFPDVVPAAAGQSPELLGWVGIGFESDSTPFSRIRDKMNDAEERIEERLREVVEPHPLDPADPGAALPALVAAVRHALRFDLLDFLGTWLSSFGDPDDLIGIQAGVLVAAGPELPLPDGTPVLRQQEIATTFAGDGAVYQVTGSVVVEAGPGHVPPPTVAAANADLPRRRTELLRAWGLRLHRELGGRLPDWVTYKEVDGGQEVDKEGANQALRMIAAGAAVFAESEPGATGRPAPPAAIRPADWALFSGRPEAAPRTEHRDGFRAKVDAYAATVRPFKQLGTKGIPGKITAGISEDENGDYDFTLRDVIALVHLMLDHPQVLSTAAIRDLLCQGQVEFPAEGPPVGGIPFAGQDPDEWFATGHLGSFRFVDSVELLGVHVAEFKGSVSETENHLLGIWSWRYLVNEYLTWVSTLPAGHPRYDAGLAALVAADPDRYVNRPQTREWVLQLLGRVAHSGTFESNAKPYESITILGLLAFFQCGDRLFPGDADRARVTVAARNALDQLATEFAFQSFEGKRLAPIRRNIKQQDNIGFYASDYAANIFGVLTGAYTYSDSIGAEISREVVCPGLPEEQFCDLAAAAPADDPAWAGPYYWFRVDQNAGFALWALVSGYRVPASIHDFLLNRHGGWFSRINTRYSRDSYPLGPENFSVFLGPFDIDPPDPEFARARYFQGQVTPGDWDVAGPGPFKPLTQNYFAAPTYLNSAGGRATSYYDFSAEDLIPEVPVVDVTGPIRDWIDGKLMESEALHSYDTLARPSSIIPAGNVQVYREKDVPALERLLPTMRGRDVPASSQNLNTYKSFSLGYTYRPGDDRDRHLDWPQRYPKEWDAHLAERFGIGRAALLVFDFTAAPGHPLAGHYWVVARVNKSDDDDDQFLLYGRGFWEVVPGHRYDSAADLRAHLEKTNPADHFTDDTEEHYRYRLASSGELVDFHNKFGSAESDRAILSITGADGTEVPLDRYTADITDAAGLRALPLLDAWQVDRDYGTTGLKYAYADGRGRLTVHNPFVGETLELDTSDHRRPTRVRTTPAPAVELPPVPGTAGQLSSVAALALDGDTLWATHYTGPALFEPSTVPGELVELDRHTLAVRGRVTVGKAPHAIALHEPSRRLFVVNYYDNSVSVVDADTRAVVGTLAEPGFGMSGIAVSRRYARVYVPQFGQHRVLVYDAHTLALTGTLTGLQLSGDVAVHEATDRLYVLVGDPSGQHLVEFAIGAGGQQEVRRTAVPGQVSRPCELAVDADRLWLLTRDAAGTGQQLLVLDRATLGTLGALPLPADGIGVSASASQRVCHVTTQYGVLVVDADRLAVLRSIPLPYAPKRVVVTDEPTGTAWYGSAGASTLTMLGAPRDGMGGL